MIGPKRIDIGDDPDPSGNLLIPDRLPESSANIRFVRNLAD